MSVINTKTLDREPKRGWPEQVRAGGLAGAEQQRISEALVQAVRMLTGVEHA